MALASLTFIEQMPQCFHWRIDDHARPYPPHDLSHPLSLCRSIAVAGATLASWLFLLPATAVQAVLAVRYQRFVILVRLLLMKAMTAIEPDHIFYRMFLSVNDFTHSINRFPILELL